MLCNFAGGFVNETTFSLEDRVNQTTFFPQVTRSSVQHLRPRPLPRIGQRRASRQDRPCGATFVSVRRFGAPPCADSKRLGTLGTLPRGLRDGTSIGPSPAAAPVVRTSSTEVLGVSGRLDSNDKKSKT